MILGHEILKEAMEVGTCRRIGILIDHQTGTGVLDKDRGKTRADAAGTQEGLHLIGNLIGSLPSGRYMEALGDGLHTLMNGAP